MEFYRELSVEVKERGYTILQDFTDPSDIDLFRYVNRPFSVTNDADLKWEHIWPPSK